MLGAKKLRKAGLAANFSENCIKGGFAHEVQANRKIGYVASEISVNRYGIVYAMKTLGERVTGEREARGWSQAELAAHLRRMFPMLKTKQSTIHSIEAGQSKKPTIIVELAKLFGVQPEWLKTGKGPKEAKAEGAIEVPIYGYAGARERIDIVEGDGHGMMDQIPVPTAEDNYCAVIVRGSSMLPAYRDGDYLFFKQDRFPLDQILNRDCVVITDQGRAYVKRVKSGRSAGSFDLLSYNHEIDPITDVQIEAAWPIEWIRRK